MGLRRPRPGAVVAFPALPRGGNGRAQLPDNEGHFTLDNYLVMTEPDFIQILRNNAPRG